MRGFFHTLTPALLCPRVLPQGRGGIKNNYRHCGPRAAMTTMDGGNAIGLQGATLAHCKVTPEHSLITPITLFIPNQPDQG